MNIIKGSIVKATAGRDKDKLFVVLDITDEQYSLIADGRSRRVEKPKKKKIKHLEFFAEGEQDITAQLVNDGKVTNARLKKALAKFNVELS